MLDTQQKNRLLELLNQVLPKHADGMVGARARLANGQEDFTDAERIALAFMLDHAEYQGRQDQVLAQMTEVAALRSAVMPPVAPSQAAADGKKVKTKKPAAQSDGGAAT